jgi:Autotransporter beta-domain/Bacterial Ig-like domain (group 3)/IPT/TIG domain
MGEQMQQLSKYSLLGTFFAVVKATLGTRRWPSPGRALRTVILAALTLSCIDQRQAEALVPGGAPATVLLTGCSGYSATSEMYTFNVLVPPVLYSYARIGFEGADGNTVSQYLLKAVPRLSVQEIGRLPDVGGTFGGCEIMNVVESTPFPGGSLSQVSRLASIFDYSAPDGNSYRVTLSLDGVSSTRATASVKLLPPQPPTVTAINPADGPALGGTVVTITGRNFTGATAVSIAGTPATSVSVVSPTSITAMTPAGSVGSASVLVTTPGGSNAANTFYNYAKAAQTVAFSSMPPASPAVGGTYAVTTTPGASSSPVVLSIDAASTPAGVCTVAGLTVTFAKAGTCIVDANQAADANYTAAPQVQQSITVAAAQTISFGNPGAQTFGAAPFALTATATSSLPVSLASTTTSVCTVSGSTVTLVGGGSCSITATQAGDANYTAATAVTQAFTVGAAAQTISFTNPGAQTFGAAPFALTATATSGLAVSFASTTASVCTVSGSTVTLVGSGSCSINATQAGNANYTAATAVTQAFTVGTAAQTISFTNPGAQTFGAAPVALTASTTSSLPVSFASTTASVCTVSGNMVTLVGGGSCSINATQAGNANYTAATAVTQAFTVGAAAQTITFTNPGAKTLGAAPLALTATATSSLPVSLASTTPTVCTVAGSTVTLLAAGNCAIEASQSGNTNYNAAPLVTQAFSVASNILCTGTLAPNGIANLTYSPNSQNFPVAAQYQNCPALSANRGATGSSVTYSSAVTTPGSVSSTASGGNTYFGQAMSLNAGLAPGNYSVLATYAPDPAGNYLVSNGPVTIGFSVLKANQAALTASVSPSTVTNGGTTTLGTSGGTGTGAVTYAVTSGSCSVSGNTLTANDVGSCNVTATKAADTNYNVATANVSVTVGAAAQTISFTNPGAKTFGVAPFALTATATSNLPISFTSTTTSVCTVSGSTVTLVAGGSCSITATQAGNANYAAATAVTQAFTVGAAAQTISFTNPGAQTLGAAPFALTAAATSSLPVSFASTTPAVCAVSGSTVTLVAGGSCSITATQAGNATYAAATAVTQTFAVTQITTTTTLSSSNTSPMMGAPVTFTATVTQNGNASASNASLRAAAANAAAPLSGSVTFTSGGTTLCNDVALANGQATCTTTFNTPGAHNVTARYAGGDASSSSTSSLVTQTVTDQRVKTAETISKFVGQRNNQVLSNGPSEGRQIDRLMEAGRGNGDSAAGLNDAGAAQDRRATTTSRLGAGPDAGDSARLRFGAGLRNTPRDAQSRFGASQTDGNPFPMPAPLGGILANDSAAQGGAINLGALRMNGTVDGASSFGFSTSLRDLYRHGAELRALKAEGGDALGFGGGAGPTPGAHLSPFDLWIEGKYASFRDKRTTTDLDGHFGIVTIGADYVLNPKLLVGTLVQFDSLRQSSTKQSTEASGNGWMAGPYATLRLTEHVFLQGRAAWGQSSNEVSPFLTYVDKFDSTRWLASATLSGRWTHGAWAFRPSASVSYIEDVTKSYADTFGVVIPSVKSQLGQAKMGPEVSYKYHVSSDLVLEPRAGVQLIWNFAGGATADGLGSIGGDAAGPSGARGRAELGVRATTSSGIGLDLSGSYDGIGASGYSATTGRATLRVPLP